MRRPKNRSLEQSGAVFSPVVRRLRGVTAGGKAARETHLKHLRGSMVVAEPVAGPILLIHTPGEILALLNQGAASSGGR